MPPKYTADRRGFAQLLRSAEMQAGVMRLAQPEAARLMAATPTDTFETRDSTQVVPWDFGDRLGAMITQDGASVQQHYGNSVTRATHYATRGR